METPEAIYFFTPKCEKYGYLSNFYKTNLVEEEQDKLFNCSEHYFMYYKCLTFDPTNSELLEKIYSEESSYKVKKLGRQVKHYDDKIWSEKRYSIMINALRLKFTQNKVIKDKLLSTKPKILYEASPFDKLWGIGYSSKNAIIKDTQKYGQNLLGKALMQVRDEL
jgi:ribA/ribD-fused uncharacterized protein